MPQKANAIKALRQAKKRAVRNRTVRDEVKRAIKNVRKATIAKSAEAEQMLKATVRLVDKSVKKKVLNKNAAARTKSRLMKLWQKNAS